MTEPSYIELFRSQELNQRVNKAWEMMKNCQLCPHHCQVDRTQGETGYCNIGSEIKVASYAPHYGEEDPLVGRNGSGTIFFSGCNLHCIYCQNYDISQGESGREVSIQDLAEMMISLQKRGCHNINFVTPSHMIYAVLAATEKACQLGLKIPLVYNTGGYDDAQVLQELLAGVIDIYMPDLKYADEEIARQYSQIKNYPQVVKAAIKEMHCQVGDLQLEKGVATQGLIVRHLLLPNQLAGSADLLDFIKEEISANTYLNIMGQYYPAYQAHTDKKLKRRLHNQELKEALNLAKEKGLTRGP
ncbi:radical SAM protein [Fuchsiella alkaliacetigena]|uniref:radical SAM protein n=1 Tax=Fuchsiella alkaliacetigena TaxID=957042 RepID=UPI00200ACB88|nr:radical SAM protein [Fuchsiella alkaliacetigena]MCK8824193.1 radical SAM protein [Fuchsiella alkaliacetigena]